MDLSLVKPRLLGEVFQVLNHIFFWTYMEWIMDGLTRINLLSNDFDDFLSLDNGLPCLSLCIASSKGFVGLEAQKSVWLCPGRK